MESLRIYTKALSCDTLLNATNQKLLTGEVIDYGMYVCVNRWLLFDIGRKTKVFGFYSAGELSVVIMASLWVR